MTINLQVDVNKNFNFNQNNSAILYERVLV